MRWRRLVVLAAGCLSLAAGLVLTVVRATDPGSGWGIRLEAFTPAGVVLHAVAAVLLLAATWRLRRVARLVVVVPLAGLALHLHWIAPLYLGPDPPPDATSPPLVLMTANLKVGHADGPAVVADATDAHVDVLALEEVGPGVLRSMRASGLDQLLPYHVGQARDGSSGTMLFSRTPVRLVATVPTRFGTLVARTRGLTVMAVHPAPPTDPARWRSDQALLVSEAASRHPDVVMGDFNATLDHPSLRTLEADGLRSVTELANQGWQPTWPSNGLFTVAGLPLPPLVQIDHVLVARGLAALDSHSIRVPGTDHRALVARVASKKVGAR